jgi:Opacity protein and related surface antigens
MTARGRGGAFPCAKMAEGRGEGKRGQAVLLSAGPGPVEPFRRQRRLRARRRQRAVAQRYGNLVRTMSIKHSLVLIAFALSAGAAHASGPVTVQPEEVYVVPQPMVRDWAGAYGGLSLSHVSGGITENYGVPLLTPDFDSTGALGLFVGYNWQQGNFVYGGELTYTHFDTPYTGYSIRQEHALELRARAGYAFDSTLVYGFVGAARSTIASGLPVSYSQNGYSFGVGVQTFVSDHVFVGLEAARRSVDFGGGGIGVRTAIDTISLRVGYQF